MDTENTELFSSNFLSQFYLGKLKKDTGFNKNHEYNILLMLNRHIFGTVGKTENSVFLV